MHAKVEKEAGIYALPLKLVWICNCAHGTVYHAPIYGLIDLYTLLTAYIEHNNYSMQKSAVI